MSFSIVLFLVQSADIIFITKALSATPAKAAPLFASSTRGKTTTLAINFSNVSYGLVHESFNNVGISVLTSNPSNAAPESYEIIEDFASLQSITGFLRHKVYGWFLAPLTGNYTFTSSCNFTCQLYLSNNSNPLNKTIIINNNSVQKLTSNLVFLRKKKIYYIEAVLSTVPPKATYHLSIGIVYTDGIIIEAFQYIPANLLGLIWTENGNTIRTASIPIKECIFYNGLFTTCVCRNGQKILNNIIYCQDSVEIIQDSLLMEDEVPLARNTYVTTLKSLNKEYSVLFEVKPNAFDHNWRSVIHLFPDNSNDTTHNSNPAIYFAPNGSLYVTSTINGSFHSFYYSMLFYLKTWSQINVRQEFYIESNTYQYSISVNGTIVYSTTNKKPVELSNIKVYAANPWYVSQNGFIRNLIIISETCDAMFMGRETALIKGLFSGSMDIFFEEYVIIFDLKLTSYVLGIQNVLYLTINGSNKHGDNYPFVDFYSYGIGNYSNGVLVFNFAINNASKQYYSLTTIPLAQWVAVKISQRFFNGTYKYTVYVNQSTEYTTIVTQPIRLFNVLVYTSDPFLADQPGFIRNLNIVSRSPGVWTQWTDWSNCSDTCVNCMKNRSRTCIVNNMDGDCLGNSTEFDTCIGIWMQWSSWSECAPSCGVSVMNRSRICNNTRSLYDCYGNNTETISCISNKTCVGVWVQWSNWSECLTSCGVGLMNRSLVCNTTNTVFNCSGNITGIASCISNITCLGIWMQWSSWSECAPSCGVSVMNRSRICNSTKSFYNCYGNNTETISCISNETCVGVYFQWSNWSECLPSCGESLMSRSLICNTINMSNCLTNITEIVPCISNVTCLDVWTHWSNWSECLPSCGLSVMNRSLICNTTNTVFNCTSNITETASCISNITCLGIWMQWSSWSECAPSCGVSVMNRSRICNSTKSFYNCYGNNTETISCISNETCVGVYFQWSNWSECLPSCGESLMSRSLICNTINMSNCLTNITEIVPCISNVTCLDVWTLWSNWSECLPSCGLSVMNRSLICNTTNTVFNCTSNITETASCISNITCLGIWMQWSSWSECAPSCGVSVMNRSRICNSTKSFYNCYGNNTETISCISNETCVGVYFQWSNWSECLPSCGESLMSRSLICNTINMSNCLTNITEIVPCISNVTCLDVWTHWSNWSECLPSCGLSVMNRSLICNTTNTVFNCTSNITETASCISNITCLGIWMQWSSWSECAPSCGVSVMNRSRICNSTKSFYNCYGNNTETISCISNETCVGVYFQWSNWSECLPSCGESLMSRSLICNTINMSNCLTNITEIVPCISNVTCLDVWTHWSNWSECLPSCGLSVMNRSLICNTTNTVFNCTSNITETASCISNITCLGIWMQWSSWSECAPSCGVSVMNRSRICNSTKSFYNCYGNNTETISCISNETCVGVYFQWSNWSECLPSCGESLMSRSLICNTINMSNCLTNITEIVPCISNVTCLDVWTHWSNWSECLPSCGLSVMNRSLICNTTNTVFNCTSNITETASCISNITCLGIWMQWSSWSECAPSCGVSVMNRSRICNSTKSFYNCYGNNTETISCISNETCVDVWTHWSNWSECLPSCGLSVMNRSLICNTTNTVFNCTSNITETASCISNITCLGIWMQWSSWSECAPSCGVSVMNRSRICNSTKSFYNCYGNNTETISCISNETCVGVYFQWSNWSECLPSCGESLMSRSLICNTINMSNCLTNITEIVPCISNVTCLDVWTHWSNWSECLPSCGLSVMNRSLICNTTNTVFNCTSNITETASCISNITCLVIWMQWSSWSECAPSCGVSVMNRSRICNSTKSFYNCYGNNTETISCISNETCVGVYFQWSNWSECLPSCGESLMSRSLICNTINMSNCLTNITEIVPCISNVTCLDVWTHWSNWSECLPSCGLSVMNRSLICNTTNTVFNCTSNITETASCISNITCLGIWMQWSSWSECAPSCGVSVMNRSRICNSTKSFYNCYGNNTETISCISNETCVAYWAEWNNWSECMPSCGISTMNRSRDCKNKSILSNCSGNNTEVLSCLSGVTCVGEWNLWSECSQTCGSGYMMSFLRIREESQYYKTKSCFLKNCTDGAEWSTWGNFGQCSQTCGSGRMVRNRMCENVSSDNFICFGLSQDVWSCNEFLCSVNGEWTNWSEWSLCSQPCNVGETKRVRNCSKPKLQFKGLSCIGSAKETKMCSLRNCESTFIAMGIVLTDEVYNNQYSDVGSLASQRLKEKIRNSMQNMYNGHQKNVSFVITIHSIKVVYP
ncbi:SCO-spondin-like isoform X9 [Hydra vulgaris]|uniref:SCO-spondin-like isoform X9 n=1 Tax=Hydra vulgaris TaxID=6087 RepID=A0ABM4BWQ1_HYDVU